MFELNNNIKLYAFDLDGTLYVGEKAIPGAVELIRDLQKRYKVIYFTNNSTKTSWQIHEKLNRLGFNCKVDDVFSSSTLTSLYLKENNLNNLFIIGSDDFKNEIETQGLTVIQSDSADHIVVGMDPYFSYEKISIALAILLKNGKFIVCNEDCNFPVENNKYLPGCGAMVGAIIGASNKRPDYIIGKPNCYFLKKISEQFHVTKDEVVVVGDSYDSDIQMALNFGCKSILIENCDISKTIYY